MEEQRTGGGREFIFSVIWAAVMLFFGRILTASLPDYKIIGVAVTILLYCILGFFVLTRYAAIYTFTLKNDRIHIVRSIGHRKKEVDFALSQVKSVSKTRPNTRLRSYSMRTSVFSKKNVYYIVYEKNGIQSLLVCDMSRKMADKIRDKKEF